MPIVAGTIALFVVAELLTSGLYQAATAGVLLVLTGTLAHGTAVLLRHRSTPSAVVATVPPPPAEPTHVARFAELSMRETEVLRALVGGARNSDIAEALGISERTVKAHLTSIYQKLGVETRAAAVAVAIRRGLAGPV